MLRRLALLMLAWSALLGTASAQDRQPIPELSEYLTDRANVFGPMQRDALLAKLERLHDQLDAQIVVLVVPTTQPESVEEYATRVFDQWRVGRAGVDNGVLFLVAVKDRRMRIEVGYGLEGAVTDVAASRILDQRVTPAFRAGNMTQGIEAGVDGIAEAIRQAAAAPASKPGAPPPVAPRAPAAVPAPVPAPVPVPLAAASVDADRPATEDDLPAQIDPGTATAPASSPAAASRKAPSALDEAGWGAKIAVLLVAALIFVFVPPVIGGLVGGVAVGTVLNQPAMAFTGIFLLGYLHYKFIPRKPGASLGFDWLLNILLFIFSLMGRGGSGGSGGGGGGGGGRIGSTRGGGGRSGGGGASGSW